MTTPLTNVASKQFSDTFINIYQAKTSLISNAVQVVRGIVGNAYEWKLIGAADMEERGASQSQVPATNVDHTPKTSSKKNYILSTPTDIFDQSTVNASERTALATVHANAMARREDKFVIDALNASSGQLIVDGGTNMTLSKILTAATVLNTNNVDPGSRHMAVHANQLNAMLRIPEITDIDFNSIKALVNGEINTFMGFTWHIFGNRITPALVNMGLPVTANIRTCFAWHQSAAGMAYFIDPTVTIDWDPTRQSWLTISKMSGDGKALQDAGIVKIACDETAGIS